LNKPFQFIIQHLSSRSFDLIHSLKTKILLILSTRFKTINMKFFATLATLALATTALASPVLERGSWPEKKTLATRTNSSTKSEFTATPIVFCLLPAQATNIVNAFNYLLANPTAANFNATANALLSSDWTDTSDSINQLAGIPVRHALFQFNTYPIS
jgi:hypothetical protein